MLQFGTPTTEPTPSSRIVELLQLFKQELLEHGMASIEEYGDLLKWGLPKQAGVCRNLHVFHPEMCSYSDAYRGTVHYHPATIRGTILVGGMQHITYQATADPDGDRFLGEQAYTLTPHTVTHTAGETYTLAPRIPHWIKPTSLTLTYFEEDDSDDMGDLLNPADPATDEHAWEQPYVDGLLPELLATIDAALAQLHMTA